MKKYLSLFIIHPVTIGMLFITSSNAQIKLGNEWVTGGGGQRIKFSSAGITTNKNHFINSYFTGGNSCISDTNGNLIIASDGYNLYDSVGQIIMDGDTLIPNDYYLAHYGFSVASQSSIFLPIDSDKYYFITPTMSNNRYADCLANINCYFDLLLYNIIDMKANGGAGQVVRRMIPLMQNARLRKTQMMACRHGNGKDWWLLKNEGDSADVHTFLFTHDSVFDKGVQVFNQPVWGPWDIRGQSTFNNDGSMYATTSHAGGLSGQIFLANFDRCWGVLSNPKTIVMPTGSQHLPWDTTITEKLPVGLCYSPNSQFLYVVSMSNIYQFDLQNSTWFQVAGLDTLASAAQGYETAYLAPDNKIYIGNENGLSKQMSRIDNPDVKGAGCNFCPRCLRLDSLGANAYVGTPPCMPNYGLGAKTCWPLLIGQYDNEPISQLEVYPNPSSTILYIKNNHHKKKELYNSVGQKILTSKENEINVSSFSKGVYYLKVGNEVKKIIIE